MSESPPGPGNELQWDQERVLETRAAFTIAVSPPYNIHIATNVQEICP
jgi:hypothetical protein